MSLRVWLPLTKDLRNQGLDDVTVTNNGATFDANGKLGGCYLFDGSNDYLTGTYEAEAEVSFAAWVNLPTLPGGRHIFDARTSNGTGYQPMYLNNNSIQIGCSGSSFSSFNYTWVANTWYHICVTHNATEGKCYINGILIGTSTTAKGAKCGTCNFTLGSRCNQSNYSNVKLNDVRIYDHCLSSLEVKHIAQGLILHYLLNDNSIQTLDNCFINPRFDTNSGWNHWGRTGSQGSSGQSNDINYRFRSGQTYVHWVSNAANATGEYLLYQSPNFANSGGGIRSLQCICKEENSIKITDDVCFPAWNARNGGVPNSYWTSIKPLGNGFYLCRCEGISQDGSNNLVGIYVKPGYKVYFSEVYLENYKSVCSDIFFSSTIIYDTSGYDNNGTIVGSLNVDNNTPKYKISTVFNGVDNCIQIGNWYNLFQNPFTINVWFKKDEIGSKGYETLFGGASGFEIDTRAGNSQTLSLYLPSPRGGAAYSPFNLSQWYMVTMVSDGTNEEFYVDGILRKTIEKKNMPNSNYYIGAWNTVTQQNFKGQMSDFRIYATALSADDVKSLYNNSAYIDNQGNIYGAVYEEV